MRYWLVFAILLMLSEGYAAVQVFWPVGAEVGDGASFYLGKISPGHRLLIITDRGQEEDPYTEVAVTPNWPLKYGAGGDRMYIQVQIPGGVSGTKQFCLELAGEYSREAFCPSILISPGLVDFHVQRNVVDGAAGKYIPMATVVKNASAGETTIRISCSSKEGYCKPVEVHMRAGEIKQQEINVMHPFPGIYNVEITMEDISSGEVEKKDVQVIVRPTLKNNMSMMMWGLPVYAPIVMPALAILSLVG